MRGRREPVSREDLRNGWWPSATGLGATVDPDENHGLREYIREQWRRHEERSFVAAWEPKPDSP